MGSSAEKTIVRSRNTPEPVRIVNWPLRDEGIGAWLMVIVLFCVGALAGAVADSLAMGLLAFVALATSAWRFWVPVTFELSSRGIVQTCGGRRRRIPWPRIARYETFAHGVLLLTDHEPSPLASLRGLYIRWHAQRDQLIRVIDFYLQTAESEVASTTRSFRNE